MGIRILEGTNVEIADTDPTPLRELLDKPIKLAYKWKNYYLFKNETDDNYDDQRA